MQRKILTTGPLQISRVDDSDPKYLKLEFEDGYTRKLAKGGKWPPEYAAACLEKASSLKEAGIPVFIKTSQTTYPWKSTEWLCDVIPAVLEGQRTELVERLIEATPHSEPKLSTDDVVVATAQGKSYFANIAPVLNHFKEEDDLLDFTKSFERGFVSAWSAKTARNKGLPPEVRRVRIAGLGQLTKRNGFRVVAAEVQLPETSDAFKFFHVVRIDEKLEREEYLGEREVEEIKRVLQDIELKYPQQWCSWAN